MTLRRSWLYVPAHDWRKIERSATSAADVVILDLEDATPADRKADARTSVARALTEVDFGHSQRFVRINGFGTVHWRDDLAATLGENSPDGYVLAKASGPDHVRAVADVIREELGAGRLPEIAPIV